MSDDYTPWESDDPTDTTPSGSESAPVSAQGQDSAGFFDGGGAYAGSDNTAMAANIAEGLRLAGVDPDSWWGADNKPTSGDFARADRAQPVTQAGSALGKFEKFLTGAGDFANKYKTPLEMLGRGLQSAAKSKSAEKLAQKQSDARIAELNLKDRQTQAADARYSDSVKGLRPAGIVSQGQLKRVGGSAVFAGNGIINRA